MITLEELTWSRPVPGITAFQVTRGQTEPRNPYSQYNLCDYTGDDALRVLNARLELCSRLGIDMDCLVMPRQTHGTQVAVIDSNFMDAAINEQEAMLESVDALVTKLKGVCIGVNTADCVNIALTDPLAGWRGTVKRIARSVVEAMTQLGAQPSHIMATMGACICQDCFEVGDEVVEEFKKNGHDISRIASRNATTGKAHIDLRRACAITLQQAGVPAENIIMDAACSRCQSDKYFSARRLGINSGRTFTGIILN